MDASPRFRPALGFSWLTPLYDPLLRWVMREEAFKRRLIGQASIAAGQRVLDLGCGTGTLTIMIKRAHPQAEVVGLDPDPEILERARRKARRSGLALAFDQGFASSLPYRDGLFERVLASMMMHHLDRETRRTALAEVRRVLRPGGEFHIVDFGPPRTATMRLLAPLLARLEEAADLIHGLFPGMLEEAGFVVASREGFATALGPLEFVKAVPAS